MTSKLPLRCPFCNAKIVAGLQTEYFWIHLTGFHKVTDEADMIKLINERIAEKKELSKPDVENQFQKIIKDTDKYLNENYVPVSKIEEKIREHEESSPRRDRYHNVEVYDDEEVIKILKSLLPKGGKK